LSPDEIKIPTPQQLETVRKLVLSTPSKILEAAGKKYPQIWEEA
jgi:hypothetical protein